jgi:hypothetical protein
LYQPKPSTSSCNVSTLLARLARGLDFAFDFEAVCRFAPVFFALRRRPLLQRLSEVLPRLGELTGARFELLFQLDSRC